MEQKNCCVYMLSKRPMIQACVLVLKLSDRKKTRAKFCIRSNNEQRLDDINDVAFTSRLQFKEGLNTKSSKLGIGPTDVVPWVPEVFVFLSSEKSRRKPRHRREVPLTRRGALRREKKLKLHEPRTSFPCRFRIIYK